MSGGFLLFVIFLTNFFLFTNNIFLALTIIISHFFVLIHIEMRIRLSVAIERLMHSRNCSPLVLILWFATTWEELFLSDIVRFEIINLCNGLSWLMNYCTITWTWIAATVVNKELTLCAPHHSLLYLLLLFNNRFKGWRHGFFLWMLLVSGIIICPINQFENIVWFIRSSTHYLTLD